MQNWHIAFAVCRSPTTRTRKPLRSFDVAHISNRLHVDLIPFLRLFVSNLMVYQEQVTVSHKNGETIISVCTACTLTYWNRILHLHEIYLSYIQRSTQTDIVCHFSRIVPDRLQWIGLLKSKRMWEASNSLWKEHIITGIAFALHIDFQESSNRQTRMLMLVVAVVTFACVRYVQTFLLLHCTSASHWTPSNWRRCEMIGAHLELLRNRISLFTKHIWSECCISVYRIR